MSILDAKTAQNIVCNALVAQRDILLAVVRRQAGGRIDPEDVVQSAFARALERADQVRDPTRVQAWLSRLVRNVLVDHLRRPYDPVLPIDPVVHVVEEDTSDCWCVSVQVQRLKPNYTSILQRVVVEGVPVTQVAYELGLSPNNAMVRLHRARIALKERLVSHCGTTTVRSCVDCGCAERGCCPQP